MFNTPVYVVAGRHELNTGPSLLQVATRMVGGDNTTSSIVLRIVSQDGGKFAGTNECIQCCHQSAFETSADGRTWTRVQAEAASVRPGPSKCALACAARTLNAIV